MSPVVKNKRPLSEARKRWLKTFKKWQTFRSHKQEHLSLTLISHKKNRIFANMDLVIHSLLNNKQLHKHNYKAYLWACQFT